MNKIEFTIHKPIGTYKISKAEIEQFALLLGKGLDTHFMIEQSFQDSKMILEKLQRGIPLIDILCDMKGNFFEILKNLTTILPLKEAIECAQDIDKISYQRILRFLSKMAYPTFLFFFSYFLILFFESSILPGMTTFTQNDGFPLLRWIHLFLTLILFFMIGIVILSMTFVFIHPFRQWILEHVLIHSIFFLRFMTSQFASLFQACLDHGISTDQILTTLEKLKTNFWIHDIISQLLSQLTKGTSILEALKTTPLDTNFVRYFTIGTKSSSLSMMLDLYNKKVEKQIEQTIRKTSFFFQGISYFSVGMVVLTVYQVMLMPLEILNSL